MISCNDYLKKRDSTLNLKIIDQIELPKLSALFGQNFFSKSKFSSPTKPILLKKGYVPIMTRDRSASYLYISNKYDMNSSDYFCLNKNVSLNKTSQLFNFTQISILNSNKIYTNVAINFVINNQTILSNYSLNYTFNLFGSFAFNVHSLIGMNILNNAKSFVIIQRAETYPFESIRINTFELNCSLNLNMLNCDLKVNVSNYGNSFQQISIFDHENGNYESLMTINPYCKLNFFSKI